MSNEYTTQAPPTSSAIVVLAGVISLVLLVAATGFVRVISAAVVAGILFAVAGTVDKPGHPVRNIIASFVFVFGAFAIGAAMILGPVSIQAGDSFIFSGDQFFLSVVTIAVGAVSYSLTVFLTGVSITQTTKLLCINGGSLISVPLLLFLFLLIVFRTVVGPLPRFRGVLSWILTPEAPVPAIVTLTGLFGVTAGSLALAVRRLPVQFITPRSSRLVVRERLDHLTDWLLRVSIACLFVGALAFLLLPLLWESLVATLPATARVALVGFATEPSIRVVLFGVTGLALLFVLLIGVLSRIRPESIQWLQRVLAYSTVAFVAVGAVFLISADRIIDVIIVATDAGETTTELRSSFGSLPLLVGLFTVAVVMPTVLFVAGASFGILGVLTPRTAAPVVAATGLITAVIAASRLGSVTMPHIIVVGFSFVIWDIGTYGHQHDLELGHGGRRVELVHTGAVGLITVAGITTFYALQWVIEGIALEGTQTTAVFTLLGLILIFAVARV